jgi:hypothetical protein
VCLYTNRSVSQSATQSVSQPASQPAAACCRTDCPVSVSAQTALDLDLDLTNDISPVSFLITTIEFIFLGCGTWRREVWYCRHCGTLRVGVYTCRWRQKDVSKHQSVRNHHLPPFTRVHTCPNHPLLLRHVLRHLSIEEISQIGHDSFHVFGPSSSQVATNRVVPYRPNCCNVITAV